MFCCKRFLYVSIGCVFLLQNNHTITATVHQSNFSTNESSGVDTLASEDKIGVQGNWVKKKDWLLKLNDVNAQIQDLAISISGNKKIFNNKFYTADGILDGFYKNIGQQQGKIAELFESAMRFLDNKKKKDLAELSQGNDTSEQGQSRERLIKIEIVEQKINTLKSDLEQLKLDMKSIEELGKSMEARMKKVDEAIKVATDEAAAAQKSTDEAWQIIDDKKVRLKYYELQGTSLEKLKTIDSYLREDLSKDFDAVTDTIKSQVDKIMVSIKQLEDKGLIIKNRAHRVEEIKLKELKEFKEHQRTDAEELQRLAALKRQNLAQPWYKRWYTSFVESIASTINFFRGLVGAPVKKASPTPKVQAPPAQAAVTPQPPVPFQPILNQQPFPGSMPQGQPFTPQISNPFPTMP